VLDAGIVHTVGLRNDNGTFLTITGLGAYNAHEASISLMTVNDIEAEGKTGPMSNAAGIINNGTLEIELLDYSKDYRGISWEKAEGSWYVVLRIFDGFLIYNGVTKVKHSFDNGAPALDFKDFQELEVEWGTTGPVSIYINGDRYIYFGQVWRNLWEDYSKNYYFNISADGDFDKKAAKLYFYAEGSTLASLRTARYQFMLTVLEDNHNYRYYYEADGITLNFTEVGGKEGNVIRAAYTGAPFVARDKMGNGAPIEISNVQFILPWWYWE